MNRLSELEWMNTWVPGQNTSESFTVSIDRAREEMFRPREIGPVDSLTFKDERARRNHFRKQRNKGRHNGKGAHK